MRRGNWSVVEQYWTVLLFFPALKLFCLLWLEQQAAASVKIIDDGWWINNKPNNVGEKKRQFIIYKFGCTSQSRHRPNDLGKRRFPQKFDSSWNRRKKRSDKQSRLIKFALTFWAFNSLQFATHGTKQSAKVKRVLIFNDSSRAAQEKNKDGAATSRFTANSN